MSADAPARRLRIDEAERGILDGDRGVLARAITLVESGRDDDRRLAEELVGRVLPRTGNARRVGISGAPGVGKSTLIDALGTHLTSAGKTVAVLAIDPSSATTGGSILGDKTRMPRLAVDPHAFVRPSPARGELGGVARNTREAVLLCEAFGFDVVIVETVGVGQSETEVAEMVDTFLLLALAGAGDELQGVKRGIMELVDIVAVNKADGDGLTKARRAARDLANALHYMRRRFDAWEPVALTVSGKTETGIPELWKAVVSHRDTIEAAGALGTLRRRQAKRWLWREVEGRLIAKLHDNAELTQRAAILEARVERGEVSVSSAAREIVELVRVSANREG